METGIYVETKPVDIPGIEDDHNDLMEEINSRREEARNSLNPIDGEIGGTPGVGSDGNSDKGQDAPTENPSEAGSSDRSDAIETPEADAFMAEVMKEADPVDGILRKQPTSWTADEAKQVMNMRAGLPDGDPCIAKMFGAERDYYKNAYGDGPMAVDETGKPVDVKPTAATPAKTATARDADGTPLQDSLARAARRMVQAAAKDGTRNTADFAPVVKRLQDGLNMFADKAKLPDSGGIQSRLKRDGVMGRKTRSRLRDTLAADGFGRVDEALAMGRFRDFAERARSGGAGAGLAKETEQSFANLFRAPKQGGPKIESSVLQETLNGFGGTTPLNVDGDIGPKTRMTFDLVNKRLGPDRLTSGLGRMFGFFG